MRVTFGFPFQPRLTQTNKPAAYRADGRIRKRIRAVIPCSTFAGLVSPEISSRFVMPATGKLLTRKQRLQIVRPIIYRAMFSHQYQRRKRGSQNWLLITRSLL